MSAAELKKETQQGKSEEFDSCARSSNLAWIGFQIIYILAHVHGLVQDCGISIAYTLDILQS